MTLVVGLEKQNRNSRKTTTFSLEYEAIDYRSENNGQLIVIFWYNFQLQLKALKSCYHFAQVIYILFIMNHYQINK